MVLKLYLDIGLCRSLRFFGGYEIVCELWWKTRLAGKFQSIIVTLLAMISQSSRACWQSQPCKPLLLTPAGTWLAPGPLAGGGWSECGDCVTQDGGWCNAPVWQSISVLVSTAAPRHCTVTSMVTWTSHHNTPHTHTTHRWDKSATTPATVYPRHACSSRVWGNSHFTGRPLHCLSNAATKVTVKVT